MCIVVDTNSLSCVFNENDKNHLNFVPVRSWVIDGSGHLVFGGTKYKAELEKMPRYLRLVRLLKDQRKAYEISESLIDQREREIMAMTGGTACDDQHIIAIFAVSRCRLFCSRDGRADRFIKDPRFYPRGQQRPRIYRSLRNRHLLCDRFIVSLLHVV